MQVLQWLLMAGIAVTLILSLVFSFKSRRSADPRLRGLNAARMNIFMGLMLLLVATVQIALYRASTLQVIVGTLFALLGLFNLFAGIRNRTHYASLRKK